jgi:hypothetical protein
LNLNSDILVSSLCFTIQLVYRYTAADVACLRSLRGFVRGGGGGGVPAPIAGASLGIEGVDMHFATSALGYFARPTAVGKVRVTASAPGYEPQTLTVKVTESGATLDFTLVRKEEEGAVSNGAVNAAEAEAGVENENAAGAGAGAAEEEESVQQYHEAPTLETHRLETPSEKEERERQQHVDGSAGFDDAPTPTLATAAATAAAAGAAPAGGWGEDASEDQLKPRRWLPTWWGCTS